MKKLLYIVSITISALFFLESCSDFLDKEPPLYVTDNDIYTSPTRIESTLLGLYGSIKNTNTNDFSKSLLGGKGYLVFDNRGDDLINRSSNNVVLVETYHLIVNPGSSENIDYWWASYLAINRVNVFLENIEGAQEVLGSEKYNQFKAEASFIRAICYYYLNNLYAQKPYIIDNNAKSVPLRLTANTSPGGSNMPASTAKEVYDQILKDLDASLISTLPDAKNTYDATTRATKGAANMLKMRVYMAMGDWQKAVECGNAVKASGYSLADDVTTLYKTPYYSAESIFSLPMATNNTPNTQQGLAEYYIDGNILVVDLTNGIMSKPNYSLATDDRVKNFLNKEDNNRLLKFPIIGGKLDWVPIMRFGETLLSLAECHANLGGAANEDLAKGYLKQVRSRSIKSGDPLNIDALSGAALKSAIDDERRLELIGEGIRGVDIFRKGENFKRTAGDITPGGNGYSWPYPNTETSLNEEL